VKITTEWKGGFQADSLKHGREGSKIENSSSRKELGTNPEATKKGEKRKKIEYEGGGVPRRQEGIDQ